MPLRQSPGYELASYCLFGQHLEVELYYALTVEVQQIKSSIAKSWALILVGAGCSSSRRRVSWENKKKIGTISGAFPLYLFSTTDQNFGNLVGVRKRPPTTPGRPTAPSSSPDTSSSRGDLRIHEEANARGIIQETKKTGNLICVLLVCGQQYRQV